MRRPAIAFAVSGDCESDIEPGIRAHVGPLIAPADPIDPTPLFLVTRLVPRASEEFANPIFVDGGWTPPGVSR